MSRIIRLLFVLSFALILAILCFSGCTKEIDISGTKFPSDAKELTIKKFDSDDFYVFSEFEELASLNVTALDLTTENYERLAQTVGDNVTIYWSVPLSAGRVENTASELSFTGDISDEDAAAAGYFRNLSQLTVSDSTVDANLSRLLTVIRKNNPDIAVTCTASVCGVKLKDSTKTLKLNKKKVRNLEDIHNVIAAFPDIRTIEMCGCGVSNEKMQELREQYPDVKFVWTISFLKYRLRTDIQVFSMLAADPSRPGDSKTFSPLFRYCTELRALDLGHMRITDISEIRNLKKLHTLILADNSISDISPLADLKELEFVELFCNRIKDVSPLAELPKLEDVNLCFNSAMKNPTAITGCKSLKRLYISNCSLDANEIAALKKGVPKGGELNYTAPNAVHSGWRTDSNARSVKIRRAFKNWRKVKAYPTWDNIIYK